MPRRQSKFLFACARLTRETTNRNPKTDSTLRFRPLGLDMMNAYPAIAWLCWVPNAILAELYLRKYGASSAVAAIPRSSPPTAPVAARACPMPLAVSR